MHSATPILIIEDSVVTSVAVGRILEQAVPGCHIVRAQSCFEAQLLLRIYDFRLAVLDVNLPDGCGLDLVPSILSRKPPASIIVMTADPRPEHRQRSCHLGIHHFIPKPIEAEALREAARTSIGRGGLTDQQSLFSASLKGVSLFDIVQLKCLSRVSCRLEISSAEPALRFGAIDFDRGEITHAEVRDPSLEKLSEGVEALERIFSWGRGNIEDSPAPSSADRTIQVPWQMLLLTVAQRTDEKREAGGSGFRPAAGISCRKVPPQVSHTSFLPKGRTDPRCPVSPNGRE